MSDVKIGIIGAGNMGGAFYKSLIALFPKNSLYVCDSNAEKLAALKAKNSSSDLNGILDQVEVVILAVKPQSFDELCKSLKVSLKNKLIVSIMAGVSVDRLKTGTGANKIVRSMPNLPVQVGKGVIGWVASSSVTKQERGLTAKLFSAMGHAFELEKESMLDSITALSGCGPAYFFYLTEQLAKKAREWGFSETEAQTIAEATFIGSAELMKNSQKSAGEWKASVASKGGVTEAALSHLARKGFGNIFHEALESARKRSEELNR